MYFHTRTSRPCLTLLVRLLHIIHVFKYKYLEPLVISSPPTNDYDNTTFHGLLPTVFGFLDNLQVSNCSKVKRRFFFLLILTTSRNVYASFSPTLAPAFWVEGINHEIRIFFVLVLTNS